MKYVSIDVETGGLDPKIHSLLAVVAILEDTEKQVPVEELPTFKCVILESPMRVDWPAAIMNAEIFKLMQSPGDWRLISADNLSFQLSGWLSDNQIFGKILAAGKNFAAFDSRFLEAYDVMKMVNFHHRSLDPAMLYLKSADTIPPSLTECAKRAGLVMGKLHDPVDDARMVIRLLRAKWTS